MATTSIAASPSTGKEPETNPRGIPRAPFIEDVEKYLGGPEEDADKPLQSLQEMLAKYRFMEQNVLSRRRNLEEKVPDFEQNVAMVELLQKNKVTFPESSPNAVDEQGSLIMEGVPQEENEKLETLFELSDTMYTRAEIEDTDEVYIWLGANTMLSYPLEEAHNLLTSKLRQAGTSLIAAKEDMEFLREQITTTEVNVARVYNWDVKRRRERREKEEAESGKGKRRGGKEDGDGS